MARIASKAADEGEPLHLPRRGQRVVAGRPHEIVELAPAHPHVAAVEQRQHEHRPLVRVYVTIIKGHYTSEAAPQTGEGYPAV